MPDASGLTVLDPNFQYQRERTKPGMAHWAGTGPRGKTCGDCEFLTKIQHGLGMSARCGRYHQMMGRWGTVKIPESTPSCKYYEAKHG